MTPDLPFNPENEALAWSGHRGHLRLKEKLERARLLETPGYKRALERDPSIASAEPWMIGPQTPMPTIRELPEEPSPGLLEGAMASARTHWVHPYAVRQAREVGFSADPGFDVLDHLEEHSKGVAPHLQPELGAAVSLPHLKFLHENLVQRTNDNRTLAELGVPGLFLQMGVAVADPVSLGLTALTLGKAAPLLYGARLSRLNKAIRIGLATAAPETAVEAYITSQDPERSASDLIYFSALSFALPAGIGAMMKPVADGAKQVAKRIELEDIQKTPDVELTKEGRMYYLQGWTPEEQDKLLRKVLEFANGEEFQQAVDELTPAQVFARMEDEGLGHLLPGEEDALYILRQIDARGPLPRAGGPQGRVVPSGATFGYKRLEPERASVQPVKREAGKTQDEPPKPARAEEKPTGWNLEEAAENIPVEAENPVGIKRWDITGRLKNSISVTSRAIAHFMGSETYSTVLAGGARAPSVMSSGDFVNLTSRVFNNRFSNAYRPAFRAWRAETGNSGWFKSSTARSEFNELVTMYRRSRLDSDLAIDVNQSGFEHVKKVGDFLSDEDDLLLKMAKEYKVTGFQDIEKSQSYVTRLWDQSKITKQMSKYARASSATEDGVTFAAGGNSSIERLIATALRRKNAGLSWKQAKIISSVAFAKIRGSGDANISFMRMFSDSHRSHLREVLEEAAKQGKLDAKEIPDLIKNMAPGKRPDKHARAKDRLAIDEAASIEVMDAGGARIGTLRISDLLENDAEKIRQVYTRQMIGLSGSEEVLNRMPRGPDGTRATYSSIRENIRAELQAAGKTKSQIDAELEDVDVLWKHTRGEPLYDRTKTSTAAWYARQFQFLRLMGQVGFSQVGEFGIPLSEFGIKSLVQQMPALSRTFSRARNGELSDEFLNELDTIWAVATEFRTGDTVRRLSVDSDELRFLMNMDRAQSVAHKSQRAVAYWSGLVGVHTMQKRMTVAMALQNFANMVAPAGQAGYKIRARNIPSKKRLDSVGLTRDDAIAIAKQIHEHGDFAEGILGRRVRQINLGQWSDPDLATKLIHGVEKWHRRVIQEHNVTEMSRWMTKDIAKIFLQFRMFNVMAIQKQTLYALNARDVTAFNAFTMSMFFASLAYVGRTYINSIGRTDRDEYLEKRLSLSAISLGAFQKAGASSMIPDVFDTVAGLTTGGSVFHNYGRSTGLETALAGRSPVSEEFFASVPVIDNLNQLVASSSIIRNWIDTEKNVTQSDLRKFTRALPFQNMIGVANVLGFILNQANVPRRQGPQRVMPQARPYSPMSQPQ